MLARMVKTTKNTKDTKQGKSWLKSDTFPLIFVAFVLTPSAIALRLRRSGYDAQADDIGRSATARKRVLRGEQYVLSVRNFCIKT
ncbi:MAG: hypothetical protein V1789_01320 [PVC group bacterium]